MVFRASAAGDGRVERLGISVDWMMLASSVLLKPDCILLYHALLGISRMMRGNILA